MAAPRSADLGDLPVVRTLLSVADLPTDGLESQFPDGYSVLEIDGVVGGAAGIEVYGEAGLLRSVVVDATLRTRGLGRVLVDERVLWAKRRGLLDVYLLTTTAPDFFARLGFVRIERSTAPAAIQASSEFASICPTSAICMRLPLRPIR
jgi:amino-acid N-acetyltransferase